MGRPVSTGLDEKGNPYVTEPSGRAKCLWCNTAFSTRAAGRRPKYCSPACRVNSHRAVQAYERAYHEAQEAQARANAALRDAERLAVNGIPARRALLRFAPASNETDPAQATIDEAL